MSGDYVAPTAIRMVSNRGTTCTVPAHMGPGLIARGYTMADGHVEQSGASSTPAQLAALEYESGDGRAPGTPVPNPFD